MVEFFSLQFIQYALIAGTAVAIAGAFLGNFIVAARQSLVSDILAHASLAGVGLGVVLGTFPSVTAGVVTVAGGVFLWYLLRDGTRTPESVGMMILTGGLALALLFAHVARDNPISFDAYLFGSILTISGIEVITSIILSAIVVGALYLYRHRFIGVVFDPLYMRTRIVHAAFFEILFMVLISAVVAISLKIIGGLLIGALFVIPAISAQIFARSFMENVVWSIVFGVAGIWLGIVSSFYCDIPASSGIVLSLIGLFFIIYIFFKNR